VLFPLAFLTDRLLVGALTTLVLIVVAVWQTRHPRSVPQRAGTQGVSSAHTT
jgi:hypothetical protein